MFGFVDVFAQILTHDFEEMMFGGGKEILPNTGTHVEIPVIGNLLLIVFPYQFFAFQLHSLPAFLYVSDIFVHA